jgi:hypothetical protein
VTFLRRVFIYTFGLVDRTVPWGGKVHRKGNTYVRWRLGAFWDGALDPVFGHRSHDWSTFDEDSGRYLLDGADEHFVTCN